MKDTQVKKLDINTKVAIRNIIRLIVQSLEILNKVKEEEFRLIIPRVKEQKQNIKGVLDNAGRGNVFMMLFFIREILEHILNEEKP